MSDGKDAPERRTEARRDWWFPVRVQASGTTADAVCRDVSARGMQLALAEAVPEGARVSLSFELPDGTGLRTLAGRIVRSEPNAEESRVLWPHKAGVELDHADAALSALSDSLRLD